MYLFEISLYASFALSKIVIQDYCIKFLQNWNAMQIISHGLSRKTMNISVNAFELFIVELWTTLASQPKKEIVKKIYIINLCAHTYVVATH